MMFLMMIEESLPVIGMKDGNKKIRVPDKDLSGIAAYIPATRRDIKITPINPMPGIPVNGILGHGLKFFFTLLQFFQTVSQFKPALGNQILQFFCPQVDT